MLANAIMVILLQYINVLNQNIVLLKFTQCYMSIISQFKFFFLKEEIATHSSILTWKIPWTEEPGRSLGVHGVPRVGHD